jgi:hypothetical protein
VPFPNPTTQFKPGQSGNPGGCPPGRSLTARLRDLLEKGEIGGKPIKDGRQVADLLMEALLKGALKGDVRHIQEVYNRVEGKVPDRIAGPDGGPLFRSEKQQQVLTDPRACELLCELDEHLSTTPAGDQPGGICPPDEPGPLDLPPAPGPAEP